VAGRIDVSDKPKVLGLLNAIALGEGRAHTYLRAWVDKTDDPDVRRVLETVAIREGEHALAFEKRICELGYSLRQREDENLEKSLALVTSDRSDLEKFEKLGLGGSGRGDGADPFSKMFEDTTIDIQTGELLGRYIAEERDSGRLLRACYEQLRARAKDETVADTTQAEDLRFLKERTVEVSAALEKVRREVSELRS
jgi:rubrerythrin